MTSQGLRSLASPKEAVWVRLATPTLTHPTPFSHRHPAPNISQYTNTPSRPLGSWIRHVGYVNYPPTPTPWSIAAVTFYAWLTAGAGAAILPGGPTLPQVRPVYRRPWSCLTQITVRINTRSAVSSILAPSSIMLIMPPTLFPMFERLSRQITEQQNTQEHPIQYT